MNVTRFLKSTPCALLLGACVVGACGDDKAPGAGGGTGGSGGGSSGGRADASVLDSGPGGASDASSGAAEGGVTTSCVLEPEQLTVKVDDRGSHYWDAMQVGDTIHLAYEVTVCEAGKVPAQRIDYLKFESKGAFPDPQKVVNYEDNTCFYTRTPTLGVNALGMPLLFYTTTSTGTSELYRKEIEGSATSDRLTVDPPGISDSEEHGVVVPYGASNLLAYVNANQRPTRSQIVTLRAEVPSATEQEIVSEKLGLHVSDLALGAFPQASALGGVLAYVADVGDPPSITAQLLDKSGKPSGTAVVLSNKVGTFSNVDLAMLPDNADTTLAGAIVYAIAPDDLHTELRFRTLGQDGTFGKEVELTTANRNAQGVSIAPFADGYVVVFRIIAAGQTSVVAKIVDKSGSSASLSERVLVPADASGSATQVFVTSDGRITVAFSNTSGQGTVLRVVRAICDP